MCLPIANPASTILFRPSRSGVEMLGGFHLHQSVVEAQQNTTNFIFKAFILNLTEMEAKVIKYSLGNFSLFTLIITDPNIW